MTKINNNITIKKFEQNLEKYNGKKINLNEVYDYYTSIDNTCKPVDFTIEPYEITETYILNEHFYGVYVVDLKNVDPNAKIILEEGVSIIKDMLIFIGTEDGIHIDYAFPLTNPFCDEKKYDKFLDDIYDR